MRMKLLFAMVPKFRKLKIPIVYTLGACLTFNDSMMNWDFVFMIFIYWDGKLSTIWRKQAYKQRIGCFNVSIVSCFHQRIRRKLNLWIYLRNLKFQQLFLCNFDQCAHEIQTAKPTGYYMVNFIITAASINSKSIDPLDCFRLTFHVLLTNFCPQK